MYDETLPVLEAAALERVRQIGGERLVARLLATFLDAAPLRVAKVTEGARVGDFDTVKQGVHSLKSMAGNVGAARLQALTEALEQAAVKGDAEAVRAGGEELEREYVRVEASLAELVAGGGPGDG